MHALKVLYLLHDSRRSGVPAVLTHFVRNASLVNIEPTVLFAYDGPYAEDLRSEGIPVITLGRRLPFLWRSKRFLLNGLLIRLVKRYDAVHVHSTKMALSVLCAHLLGAKVVFHLHELPRRIDWILKKAIGIADEVVFCSATCAAHFASVPAKHTRILINALQFSDAPPVCHEGEGKRIIMLASINRSKGQDQLLQAFSKMKHREAHLYFYGTTGLSAHRFVRELKQFAAAQGLAGRVFFPGPTTDALKVLSESSVVVHTSQTESFGMALVEAMSCGIPVIANDVEGMKEVVQDGVTGFLVAPGDFGRLADLLDLLIEKPGLRMQIGANAYKVVRQRFNINTRIKEYRALYEELCGE